MIFRSTDPLRCLASLAFCSLLSTRAVGAVEPPRVLDADWQIQLVTAEPELVTPVACIFDDAGRLLVVECHTHFPPDDYAGPKEDRIYAFDDSDGDGVVDRKRLYFKGGNATMGLAKATDGWIVVATRRDVTRIRDSTGDGVADEQETLLSLDTAATYPHNGLAGVVVGPDWHLYVGQGENFGEAYALVGSDGSRQVGGGEGGNVFRCNLDGSKLERIATGFWNPFGLYFDPAGRLWSVGNDPDAMPPCRLMQILPGGDYGFQFRFGRAGTHPLQGWNGEFPGTLPMVAGTGEAPCAVIGHDKHLWVSSWGDNRIERYQLTPRGAGWTSKTEVLVQGDANFRPVGMAAASDGSVYVTDWVDRSYPVHGKGRLWRLSRQPTASANTATLPARNDAENAALQLLDDATMAHRIAALGDDDPVVRQSAAYGLVQSGQLSSVKFAELITPVQRVAFLTAIRWMELASPENLTLDARRGWVEMGLADPAPEVVLAAIRWATERGMKDQLPAIENLLVHVEVSPRLFAAVIASIAYLETGSAARGTRDPAIEEKLAEIATDTTRSPVIRALSIAMLPAEAEAPSDGELFNWIMQNDASPLVTESMRLLSARTTPMAAKQLLALAGDDQLSPQVRADAVAGLAKQFGDFESNLQRWALPDQPEPLRQEAVRMLTRSWSNPHRPGIDDLTAWDRLVGSGGDPAAGRRVFIRSTCIECHAHDGRGSKTGPDLSTLAGTMTSQRLIQSILHPSKEIGPMYVPWRILTVDGQVLTGLKIDASGVGNKLGFQAADGKRFEVALADIEQQDPIPTSIMPSGLETTMSIDELRDLIAFLSVPRRSAVLMPQ